METMINEIDPYDEDGRFKWWLCDGRCDECPAVLLCFEDVEVKPPEECDEEE